MELINQKAIDEAVKEGLRVIIAGLPTIPISFLTVVAAGLNLETGRIVINWQLALVLPLATGLGLLIQALIKMRDKYVHEDPLDPRSGIMP